VLFGDHANPQDDEKVNIDSADPVRSIWFDASAGISYTLWGDALDLGSTLNPDKRMVIALSDFSRQTENNIEAAVLRFQNTTTARIENYSEGGLRFASQKLELGAGHITVSGSGATHFASPFNGAANFSLEHVSGTTPAHLVFSGINEDWEGSLTVGIHTLAFLKADFSLGSASTHTVESGGTLGFRSHIGEDLIYQGSVGDIYVSGQGAIRRTGRPGVGAIYNDGGGNLYEGNIVMTGHTWFGARGDLGNGDSPEGGLVLFGRISDGGNGYTFTKVGTGLIILVNDMNKWGPETRINEGILSITSLAALGGGNTNLVFGGTETRGGILELSELMGWTDDYSADLGTGPGQVRWAGSGGFANYAASNRTVSLNGGSTLTVGDTHFLQSGQRFFLSSRNAISSITLANDRDITSKPMSFHVDHGRTPDTYAILTGQSFNAATSASYYEKWGDGMLWDQSTHVGALPNYQIYGGVLRSTDYGDLLFNNNGRLGLDADFLGNATWQGPGGFAAYGGDRIVRLGNSTAPVYWDESEAFTALSLVFGHPTSTGSIIWDRPLNLGATTYRTIEVQRGSNDRADLVLNQPIHSTQAFTIKGNGRVDFPVASVAQNIWIYGPELRLNGQGRILAANTDDDATKNITLSYRGSLIIDNIGTHSSSNGGIYTPKRLGDGFAIHMASGSFRYWGKELGDTIDDYTKNYIQMNTGHNTIEIRHNAGESARTDLLFQMLAIAGGGGALNLESNRPYSVIAQPNTVRFGIKEPAFTYQTGGIMSWATVEAEDWAYGSTTPSSPGITYISAFSDYHTGNEDTWTATKNVLVTNQTLTASRTINSLKLSDSVLNLGNYNLTINAAGILLPRGKWAVINGNGALKTSPTYPIKRLTTHIYDDLYITDQVSLDMPTFDLAKVGDGRLNLDANTVHYFRNIYLFQGEIALNQGYLNLSGRLDISEGAIFRLPENQGNRLLGSRDLAFRKSGKAPGIFQMGGNSKQVLTSLTVSGAGVIDFAGGEVGRANMLWIDMLISYSWEDRLFIRNWYEYEDYLFIKKSTYYHGLLNRIVFEGYEEYGLFARDYDANYYQITPFYHTTPEPSTYGTIVGTVGLGLWLWRKRRRQRH